MEIFQDEIAHESAGVESKTAFSQVELFRLHRLKFLITYSFTITENVISLSIPYFTGLAINDALEGRFLGLIYYAGLWTVHGLTHVVRQTYNIRTFSKIYRDVAVNVVRDQKDRGIETSKIIARSGLSREFVDFFERNVPDIINTLFKSLGALGMLIMFDWGIVVFCIILLLPLYVINKRYAKKSLDLNSGINDQYEKEVGVLTRNDPADVWDHYNALRNWRIKIIDTQVINWATMELFIIIIACMIIIRAGALGLYAAGTIYSIISYMWNFIYSLDKVPALVQQISRLKDIKRRM